MVAAGSTVEKRDALQLVYAIAACPEIACLFQISHDESVSSDDFDADAGYLELKD